MVASWKGIYSYLCDCVKVVECSDIQKNSRREIYILSKGVEMMSEENVDEGIIIISIKN